MFTTLMRWKGLFFEFVPHQWNKTVWSEMCALKTYGDHRYISRQSFYLYLTAKIWIRGLELRLIFLICRFNLWSNGLVTKAKKTQIPLWRGLEYLPKVSGIPGYRDGLVIWNLGRCQRGPWPLWAGWLIRGQHLDKFCQPPFKHQ